MQEKSLASRWQWILAGIILFGTLIGFSEAVFGHLLTVIAFPYKGGLLTGISFGIIGGIALAIYRNPFFLMAIGAAGALIRMLLIPILKVSYTCFYNSSIGITLEGIAIGVIGFAFINSIHRKNILAQITTGFLGALTGSILFWAIGVYAKPGKYLLSFQGDPLKWILTEGLIWSLFTALLLPVGYLAGSKISEKLAVAMRVKAWPVYTGIAIMIIISFTVTAVVYGITL